MDWSSILTLIISNLSVGFGGWFFGRRKASAEAAQTEVSNFDAAIEAYKKLYENREEIYRGQIQELKDENVALKKEISDLRSQVLTVSNFVTAYMIQGQTPDKKALTDLIDKTK